MKYINVNGCWHKYDEFFSMLSDQYEWTPQQISYAKTKAEKLGLIKEMKI